MSAVFKMWYPLPVGVRSRSVADGMGRVIGKEEDKKTAKDLAYEYIKSRIIDMSFRAGEFITEDRIAKMLGISRTPVREALIMLERENFVRIIPKKGVFIPPITLEEIHEVMEVRKIVELSVAEKLIDNRSKILPSLREIIDKQREISEKGNEQDRRRFIELDSMFHCTMVESGGNRLLLKLYRELRDQLLRMGIVAVSTSPKRMEKVLEEHLHIVQAIEQGDPEVLKKSILAHLDATMDALKSHSSY